MGVHHQATAGGVRSSCRDLEPDAGCRSKQHNSEPLSRRLIGVRLRKSRCCGVMEIKRAVERDPNNLILYCLIKEPKFN